MQSGCCTCIPMQVGPGYVILVTCWGISPVISLFILCTFTHLYRYDLVFNGHTIPYTLIGSSLMSRQFLPHISSEQVSIPLEKAPYQENPLCKGLKTPYIRTYGVHIWSRYMDR